MGEIPSTIKALVEKKATMLREAATHRQAVQRILAQVKTLDNAMLLVEQKIFCWEYCAGRQKEQADIRLWTACESDIHGAKKVAAPTVIP